MTIYLHDGIELSPAAEPVLRSDGPGRDLPLPDAYFYHGPLIPRRRRIATTPSGMFAATVASGYVETDAEFAARIGGVS